MRTPLLAALVLLVPSAAIAGEADLASMPEDDPTGEAASALTTLERVSALACVSACDALPLLGCGAISAKCATAAFFTVGGLAIPCAAAAIAACSAAYLGGTYCRDWCYGPASPVLMAPSGPKPPPQAPPSYYDADGWIGVGERPSEDPGGGEGGGGGGDDGGWTWEGGPWGDP